MNRELIERLAREAGLHFRRWGEWTSDCEDGVTPEDLCAFAALLLYECRKVVLATGEDAAEAAKAKDAYDYVAGYQDASVDADEAIRITFGL
jgi:hypothetical protein